MPTPTLTGRPLRQDLDVLMHGLAAEDYRRRHPRAPAAAAWRFAAGHAAEFRDRAVELLALLLAERETAAAAPRN